MKDVVNIDDLVMMHSVEFITREREREREWTWQMLTVNCRPLPRGFDFSIWRRMY